MPRLLCWISITRTCTTAKWSWDSMTLIQLRRMLNLRRCVNTCTLFLCSIVRWSLWARPVRSCWSLSRMKRLGVILLPLDGMLIHRRSLPRNLLGFPNNSSVPIYTPGWREALWELIVLSKNTTQCPLPGLEPGPLDPGTSALTIAQKKAACC